MLLNAINDLKCAFWARKRMDYVKVFINGIRIILYNGNAE
jgi:hypothetical protein